MIRYDTCIEVTKRNLIHCCGLSLILGSLCDWNPTLRSGMSNKQSIWTGTVELRCAKNYSWSYYMLKLLSLRSRKCFRIVLWGYYRAKMRSGIRTNQHTTYVDNGSANVCVEIDAGSSNFHHSLGCFQTWLAGKSPVTAWRFLAIGKSIDFYGPFGIHLSGSLRCISSHLLPAPFQCGPHLWETRADGDTRRMCASGTANVEASRGTNAEIGSQIPGMMFV